MLELSLIVIAGAVAWFINKVIKTDKNLVLQRQQREIAFLAQHMHRAGPAQQPHPAHQQVISRQ